MFTTRLISGVILVIIALFTVGSGGVLLFATTVFISMIGLFELYRVMKIQKNPLGFMGYLTVLSYYGLLWFRGEQFMMLMSIAFLMILMSIYVFAFPKYQMEEVTVAFFLEFFLCCSHAVLSLSGPYHGRREISGVAGIFKLMGMRYLCLLRGNAYWESQAGTCT